MSVKTIPEHILNELKQFILTHYSGCLPNSLLVAEAFILKYPNYGKEFGLSAINEAIEEGLKHGLFCKFKKT